MYRARLKGPTDAWASLHRALLCYLVIAHNLWLIYADQVVLLDTSKMSSLGWQTFPADRHSRRGWKEASYNMKDGDVYRVYYVCNVAHESVNNWLRLPYIEREKANRLYIQIHFTVRKCTKFHDPTRLQQCRESFKLLHFQTDSDFGDDRMPIWDTETYQHIDVIAADQTFLDSANVFINTETRSVAITKKGIYFAFYDQGTCATLISIKVYYITCPTVTKNFAVFRNTTTGVDVSDIVQVKGECVENAVMDTQPRYLCSSDGKWSYLEGGCTCQSGYQPFQGSQCRACLPGHHKWSSGSDMCQPCPAHSHALSHGAVECVCQEGYYRSVTDHKSMPCTQPPSEPHNVTVLFVDQTTITLAWDPPSYLGGRHDLEYRIQCEPCDGAVSFFPRQEHFNTTMVSIEGLNPKTTYTISIFAENGVSVMVDRKVVHTVKVITIPSALTKVDQVKVLSVGLNYITLHWEWLSQAPENVDLYEVRWYPAFQQNRVRRTEAEHNNITFSNLDHNTEYIFQVRGKTKQGWGQYSFKVTVKTGTRLPSIKNIQSSKNPQHEQPVSIIAGSIVAVVMCMAIVIIMIVIFLKRNKQACNGKSLSEAEAMQYGMHDVTIPLFSPPGSIRAYVDPHTYEDPNQAVREFTKEIDSSLITIETVIGGGEFGDVCRGKLRMPGRGDLSVAIKTLKAGASDKNRLDFLTEASIMGQFDDPNVIYLEGVVTRSHPIMIVTEFMENGSLDTFLRNNDGKFTVIQLTGMMRGIASGMRYLAEMGYVHRDLAARNILVNANLVCKVADFGLSREMELDTSEGAYTTRGGKIPVRWTAPEAIAYRKFTSASDVWSYGVVMWEVMAYGERPYWNWSNQDVIKAIDKGYRLPPPMDCPEAVYQLLLDCWQKERGHRPKFSAIVKTLDKLIRAPELLRKVAKPRPYYNYVDPSLPYITEETSVHDWLISLKMERYVENFVSSGFTVMGQVAALNLKDLTNLGITLVGHQKKLLNSIQTIRLQLEDAQCTQSLLI